MWEESVAWHLPIVYILVILSYGRMSKQIPLGSFLSALNSMHKVPHDISS